MATIKCNVRKILTEGKVTTYIAEWLQMANGDVGEPFAGPGWADRNVQVLGTYGAGGSVAMQGSNVGGPDANSQNGSPVVAPAAGDWSALTEAGVALAITAQTLLHQIDQSPIWTRPNVTAGDGTTLVDVRMVVRSTL